MKKRIDHENKSGSLLNIESSYERNEVSVIVGHLFKNRRLSLAIFPDSETRTFVSQNTPLFNKA